MTYISAISAGLGVIVRASAGAFSAVRNREQFDYTKFGISVVQAVAVAVAGGYLLEDVPTAFTSGYIAGAVLDKFFQRA